MGISLILAFLPHKKRREVECPYDMRLSTAQTGKDKQPTPHKGRYAQTDRTRAACIANRCRHLHADRRERPSYSPVLKLSRFHVENKRNDFSVNLAFFHHRRIGENAKIPLKATLTKIEPNHESGFVPPHHTQKGPHRCGPLFNAGLDPIGATPLQDNIGNETPSYSFYVKHFI